MMKSRNQRGRNEEKGKRVMKVGRKKQKEEEDRCINIAAMLQLSAE